MPLPDYRVEEREILGRKMLSVVCPRRGCGGEFWVTRKWTIMTGIVYGRSCPYCFKASAIPAPLRRGKTRVIRSRHGA